MTKDTYTIEVDPQDGHCFFHQNKDEADKNHSYLDTNKANECRAYEVKGN